MRFSIVNFSVVILCCWCIDARKRAASSQSNFDQDCLNAHNYYRSLCGAPPLQLNPSMSQSATIYAQHLASTDEFQHSNCGAYDQGENLFETWSSSSSYTCSGAYPVESWYDEIEGYNSSYGTQPSPPIMSKTGHYTQVVWIGSQQLGVGVAEVYPSSGGVKYVVVCRYYPAGNVIGEFPQNVHRPYQQ